MRNSVWLTLLIAGSAWAAAPSEIFDKGGHCVAYRVEKRMFFVKSDFVTGKSCDISAQVLPEVGGLYHIEVNVPVRSFESGDATRDRDVSKLLKSDERAELTWRSKPMSSDKWRELFAKKQFALEGEILIGNQTYPLTIESTYTEVADGAEVEGLAKLKFEDVGLKPPRVGGGVIAKAKDDLELLFHLQSSRILGADSIRLQKGTQ